jgi:hypothetical protein
MEMEEMSNQVSQKIYCNTCKLWTNHDVGLTHTRLVVDSDFLGDSIKQPEQYEEWKYTVYICRGCDTASLQAIHTSYALDAEPVCEIEFYPQRERDSLTPKIFRQLNQRLTSIYREVITNYNHEASVLCAVGLRTLLEGICADKGIEGKTLFSKIDGLKSYLPTNIVESLHRYRFTGNEAAHELQAPDLSDLRVAIEVMEDLLNFLYELDYRARTLFEGDITDATLVRPNVKVIQRIIERVAIPDGQIELYKVLYEAGDNGLEITEIAQAMHRPKEQIYGVLGALGRRINNTPGISDKPGIGYVFELMRYEKGERWGWKMRRELRQALQSRRYSWAKEWLD